MSVLCLGTTWHVISTTVILQCEFISQKFIFGIFTQIFMHLLIVKSRAKVYSVVVFQNFICVVIFMH